MKSQTTIGKAFEINKNSGIYGTFAEIGAGQETVNFFYKAGLASQTVAKSMSAYDMTVSDEIYGKQNRYICKERLLTMLNHEYSLLDKRLKRKLGNKTCFFAFAVTAATSTKKKDKMSSGHQHAWMGLRFQAKPLEAFNDMTFHVNCLDKDRLQQHEALGTLGVNLTYASFYYRENSKKFVASLVENLSSSRIEIHGISFSGPAFKNFSPISTNLDTLSQNLSKLVFFHSVQKSEFISDATFNKNLVILYGGKDLTKTFRKNKTNFLNALALNNKQTALISFIPKKKFNKKSSLSHLKELCKEDFSILTADEMSLEDLKKLISPYNPKPVTFVVSKDYFTKQMFDPSFYKNRFMLKSLGLIFENKTKVAVISEKKDSSVQNYKLKPNQEQSLKDYMVGKKQIMDLKF